jgi:hypothetical protein
MTLIIRNGLFTTKSVKTIIALTGFVAFLVSAFLVSSGYGERRKKYNLTFSSTIKSNEESSLNKPVVLNSALSVHNSTHLWSMRLADENYFRLARLLPCRTVEYSGGPKIDKIDSCDHSSTNEYSKSNTLQAQKWLFEHQHPASCSDKRFAIIRNFARAGFGSTVHQIVWAFGMAIADNRIAIYQTPGKWVRQ